jgi:Xaa-Pro aminopeptidase
MTSPSLVPTAKLLYENGPDWRHATGIAISDPALWFQTPSGATHMVVSELEITLAKATVSPHKVQHIHSFGEVRVALGGKPFSLAAMVGWLAALEKTERILVPGHFPAGLMGRLQAAGLAVEASPDDLFFMERAIKTPVEIEALQHAQRVNEQAFKHAFKILKAAEIGSKSVLFWKKSPLTAELLRAEMNACLVKLGAEEFHGGPIVACGPQAAQPHERGHGPLLANQPIVIDCFPRHANGYWGDLTRTVVKGKPSPWLKKVYKAVWESQELALSLIKPGVDGALVHKAVVASLTKAGFPTGADEHGTPYGMFHGTGHGVGLELHEPGPRTLSTVNCTLQPGFVTSVEPGLYYANKATTGGVGGVRIEDVVVIAPTGHKNLTTLSKSDWIIP